MEELLLVPDSLLQFTTIHLDFSSLRERIEQDYVFSLVSDPTSNSNESLSITRNLGNTRNVGRPILLDFPGIITQLFEGQWLPLPWLRKVDERKFQNGPSNWVRGRLRRKPESRDFLLELAFDTAIERNPATSQDGTTIYNGPKPDDINNGASYALPHLPSINRNWLARNIWVQEIIRAIQDESVKAERSGFEDDTLPPPRPGELGHSLTTFAAYIALLHGLTASDDLPTVKFTDTGTKPIDVDLVLDLGNSRSSGILIEQDADQSLSKGGRFGNCRVLGLRDMRNPQVVRSTLFSSRAEFSNITFGDPVLSRRSQRDNAFSWPSPVRVGGEAEDMMAAREGTEGFSGLASPKRYLWDRAPTSQGWYFNDALESAEAVPPRLPQNPRAVGTFRTKLHEILTRKNDRGVSEFSTDLQEEALFDEQNIGPDIKALKRVGPCQLSKSEISILMLSELVLQAIASINSPQERKRREQSGSPRHLRSLALTFPPGMPLAERRILIKRAKTAITLAWEITNQKEAWLKYGDSYAQPPELECNIDEATATQLVWLENEINNKMGGSVDEFFHLYGRPTLHGNQDRLRVASLDIGGGTTDLMICDYLRNHNEEMIHPNQLFRESLRLAGDDLLEDIISGPIISSLTQYFRDQNVPEPESFFNTLFRAGAADATIQEATQRQLFISTILEPIALRVIGEYEETKPFFSGQLLSGKLNDIHQFSKHASERALRYFQQTLKKHCDLIGIPPPSSALASFLAFESDHQNDKALSFNPLHATLKISTSDMEGIITRRLGQPLKTLSSLIQAYGCDVLLLSGRPSKLPHIYNLILSALPVAPQRVILMHSYVVGGNYPFANHLNQIGDPKSTVVMGAVIWKKARRAEIDNFKLASNSKYNKSTAHFIGSMRITEGTIIKLFNPKRHDDTYIPYDMSDITTDDEFSVLVSTFEGSMMLGAQQLPNKDFPCNPFYSLNLTDAGRAALQRRKIDLNKPLSLTLRRPNTKRTSEEERRELCENLIISTIKGHSTDPDNPMIEMPARDLITATLQTTLTPKGHWRDTGVIHLVEPPKSYSA